MQRVLIFWRQNHLKKKKTPMLAHFQKEVPQNISDYYKGNPCLQDLNKRIIEHEATKAQVGIAPSPVHQPNLTTKVFSYIQKSSPFFCFWYWRFLSLQLKFLLFFSYFIGQEYSAQLEKLANITTNLMKIQESIKKTADILKQNYENHSLMNASYEHASERLISKTICPHHFQSIKSFCIYVQLYPSANWYEASAICRFHNSHLITISKENFAELLSQLKFNSEYCFSFYFI